MSFTDARRSRSDISGSCVHFYQYDKYFGCVWRSPERYLPLFGRCEGVIGPDFSMYRNMPQAMQQWACFRSRAITYWLQCQGVPTVPNVRFSDSRSWSYCFEGLPLHAPLAIGSYGCLGTPEDRYWFEMGLDELVSRLSPRVLVVYGETPDDIFGRYKSKGIEVLGFQSELARFHKRG